MTKPLIPEQALTLEDLSEIKNEIAIQGSRRRLLTEAINKVRRLIGEKSPFVFDDDVCVKTVQITPSLGVNIDGCEFSSQAALNLLAWLRKHEAVLIALANEGNER